MTIHDAQPVEERRVALVLGWDDLDRRVDAILVEAEQAVVRWVWAPSAADWEMLFELWEQRFD